VGEEFGIAAEYLNVSGLYFTGVEDLITVSAGDISGNAVPENTAISFKTYNTGGLLTPGSAGTVEGRISSTLVTTTSPVPMQGMVSITAEAVNGGRTTHVTSLAVVPLTEHTQLIYAGTDGGGVYISRDSGTSWQNISRSSTIQGQNWIDPYVNDIAVDPDNSNTIYAATGYLGSGNVYRSLDGGMNWNSNDPEEWRGILNYISIEDESGNSVKSLGQISSAVSTILCDDDGNDGANDRYVWIGTQGFGLFYSYDGKQFRQRSGTKLGQGTDVQDIVKVKDTHGDSAELYAGSASGVFKSRDGGKTWEHAKRFTGDYITTMALYPKSNPFGNDIIYVGTEGAGIWGSTDSGNSWTNYKSGMGKGLSATTPQPDVRNTGTGRMSEIDILDECQTEEWIITCKAKTNGGVFSVAGSVSGIQSDCGIGEYSIPNVLKFTITPGNIPFEPGDKFTFSTTRDPGKNIKDIIIDQKNHLLYAITYFSGPLEPHPVGNVYVHDLNIDGSMAMGDWREVNSNLPEYDPPNDVTLFAQHALAVDNPENPNALFIGGEGISFYKAVNGLAEGNPDWEESQNGLTNLVMARMPVLFSGECFMTIYLTGYESTVFEYTDYSSVRAIKLNFDVFIQDVNGNPPVIDSYFLALQESDFVDDIKLAEMTYADSYTNIGTWSDPPDENIYTYKKGNFVWNNPDTWSDPSKVKTWRPYRIEGTIFLFDEDSRIEFTFDPEDPCKLSGGPGCPGGKQVFSYD
jgi:hypothetical protein